ncbi:hypothetical protein B2G71_05155 [Novosphingobium sp. PC22D]|uniref:polysaccharide biosynthesis/export family protein n=1 Tax=Novosphingobium sp. PC22D TaxID=1962403 RepID=UPI000BF02491|nr:polysaccharide biosynthesis/export family protein [Novosphingobium sp. PC22D]PEQ13709.1 hypothetical protein B2G71_05155 [Novosphingobium sp. PC22D]
MKRWLPAFIFLALGACSGLREYESVAPSAAALPGPDESSYRMNVGDKVRVTVYNEPTLSGEYVVAQNKMISFPLIGDVPAENKTGAELSNLIAEKLADGYLRAPNVSSEVVVFRPFYILGEVGRPGEYPYSPGMTVLQAIASAEGFTYRANKRRILIKRAGSEKEVAVDITPSLAVYPGDTVRIAERYF